MTDQPDIPPAGDASSRQASILSDLTSLPPLPDRPIDAHKGSFGRVLLIGGARGMAGAIALTGMAACRAGAGLVKLGVPEPAWDTVAQFDPNYMSVGLPADSRGRLSLSAFEPICELAESADVVALGPGLGRSNQLTMLVDRLVRTIPSPMVLDADALNALATNDMAALIERQRGETAVRVLTPHIGEFRRMIGRSISVDACRQEAPSYAAKWRCTLVLKGHRTLVTDGSRQSINQTGNPGMATGGSGDILTGVIAALLGQRMVDFEAARLGCHLHGLAGDLAARAIGQAAMVASDIKDHLPAAIAFRTSDAL